ncbi:PQQ-binding-like beta-propeller repeat protein [Ktedonosporobacter rubrisoli]|nr:PQQ-binding-like beta-propeller repeat protein [Ktedonosporobacter rubrisoli]
MAKHLPEFTPEQVDAQVDGLLTGQSPASPDQEMISHLSQIYRDDERSLAKAWQRLELENYQFKSAEEQWQTEPITPQPDSANDTFIERNSPTTERRVERNFPTRHANKRASSRILTQLAAACFALLLVGSLLVVLRLVHENQLSSGSSGQQAIYASDDTHLFKLDSHTHQVLWQRELNKILKIIPAGNAVYILQASWADIHTNAVSSLDASSGKTLWTHALSPQKQDNQVIVRDMILAQGRLYVDWQSRNTNDALNLNAAKKAQIDVLNPADGKLITALPVKTDLWNMAAGNGILAVSTAYGFQVYELATGKLLWHKIFQASTNMPVASLKVSAGLIYAIVSHPESTIRAYKADTGEQVWQSHAFADNQIYSLTVEQNIVYFGTTLYPPVGQKKPTTGSIYAYDIKRNKQLWSIPVAGATLHPPALSSGMLYICADSGVADNLAPAPAHVIAIYAASGKIKWQRTLPENYVSGFALSHETIYASTYKVTENSVVPGNTYALAASNGNIQWEDNQHRFLTHVVAP